MKLKTSTNEIQFLKKTTKLEIFIFLFYFPKTTHPTPSSRIYTWQGGGGEVHLNKQVATKQGEK
jgi:hypothetical protein